MERIGPLKKETRLRETLKNYTFFNKLHKKKWWNSYASKIGNQCLNQFINGMC